MHTVDPGWRYVLLILYVIIPITTQQLMGCGACCGDESNSRVQPTRKIPPCNSIILKIENYLDNIASTKSTTQTIFPNQQIELLHSYLNNVTRSGGQLPELGLLVARESPANSCLQEQFLLTNMERSLWKAIILLPDATKENGVWGDRYPFTENQYPEAVQETIENSYYQISLDINRTYPGDKSIDRKALENVLRNLTNGYFKGIGYTQGMNFYVGFLMQCGFTESQVYSLFINLFSCKQYLLGLSFSREFKLVNICIELHDLKLREHLPELASHLSENGITAHLFCFSWFLCCFLYTLSGNLCVLIWDFMLKSNRGLSAIVSLSLKIMEDLEQDLLAASAPDQILELLRGSSLNQRYGGTNQINRMIRELQQTEASSKIGMIELQELYALDAQLEAIIHGSNCEYTNYVETTRQPERSTISPTNIQENQSGG